MRNSVAQFVAVLALDPARNAAAAGIVRHQDQITTGQADERGQRRTLVTAFVLVYLDDEFLSFAQCILDAHSRGIGVGVIEEGAADFLERKKAMAFAAVVDEGRLEAGLDAGDDTFIDIALALFLTGGFDIQVDELLAIDDRDAQFFCVGRVKQHALHFCSPALTYSRGGQTWGRPGCRGALAFRRREIHWVEEDERFWPEVCQYTSCITQDGGIHFWCASA